MSKFSVGQRINTESLGTPISLWLRAVKPRFFRLSTQLGRKTRSAVYLMVDSAGKQGFGTTFQLLKVSGHKKFPMLAVLNGGEPLVFDVEIFEDAKTLAEALAESVSDTEKQIYLNVEALLSVRG